VGKRKRRPAGNAGRRWNGELNCLSDLEFAKLADSSGGNPLGDVDVALAVEASVVWVDELPVLPFFRLLTHGVFVGSDLLRPLWVMSDVKNGAFTVDESQTGSQVRN